MDNSICCNNCKWFEARTSFCRKSPPVPTIEQSRGDYDHNRIAAMFPRVPFPNLDYCGSFSPYGIRKECVGGNDTLICG
jgi:hypothetical protein